MTGRKADLRNVSLVCVETRYPELARYAIERCRAAASFKECLLLSPTRHPLPSYIEQIEIAPIHSVAAYSEFMLRDLGRYFHGEHVLVIQWDSFILRGDLWQPEFLQYDYIGAPWPHRPVAVGNGGFSLRSRRLIEALQKIDISITHPEDYVICERHRDQLMSEYGIQFAPAALAARFAFECKTEDATFGFHGFFNFHHALDDAELTRYIGHCDDAIMHAEAARNLVRNLYHSGRYAMARRILKRRLTGAPGKFGETVWLGVRSCWHAMTHRRQRPGS